MKNIALVLNSKYVNQAMVFMRSLFENNKKSEFAIYVLNSQLSEDEINKMKYICGKFKNKLIDIKIDNNLFSNAPILWSTHSKEAYYKLLLPLVIPNEVKKILYFDIDIIVNGNIEELYNINIDKYKLAAVPDYFVNKYNQNYVNSLNIEEGKYFNSGVVLFNLDVIRQEYNFRVIEQYIEKNGKNFHYHDQEVLNAFFSSNVLLLDEKYNYMTKYKGIMDFFKYKLKKNKDILVFHYAGIKPWNNMYYGKYYNEFWKYAKENSAFDYNTQIKVRRKKYIIIILKTIKNILKVN